MFKSLGISMPSDVLTNNRKIEESIKTYNLMIKKLSKDMKEASTAYMIDGFAETSPKHINITLVKKLDMVFWIMRDTSDGFI